MTSGDAAGVAALLRALPGAPLALPLRLGPEPRLHNPFYGEHDRGLALVVPAACAAEAYRQYDGLRAAVRRGETRLRNIHGEDAAAQTVLAGKTGELMVQQYYWWQGAVVTATAPLWGDAAYGPYQAQHAVDLVIAGIPFEVKTVVRRVPVRDLDYVGHVNRPAHAQTPADDEHFFFCSLYRDWVDDGHCDVIQLLGWCTGWQLRNEGIWVAAGRCAPGDTKPQTCANWVLRYERLHAPNMLPIQRRAA